MVKMLDELRFQDAAAWVSTHGRPLEHALFDYEFRAGQSDMVLESLADFQNQDGGFGHGLEPDVQCADSSALATTLGLRTCVWLGVPGKHPMVSRAVNYLAETCLAEPLGWEIVPRSVSSAPRADWWEYHEPTEDPSRWANPNLEIVGLLHHYKDSVPQTWLAELTRRAMACFTREVALEMHGLLCALQFAKFVPAPWATTVDEWLNPVVEKSVAMDPSQWHGYCLMPLQVVGHPADPYATLFSDAVQVNLDFLIETQRSDGAWSPTWEWSRYPDAWHTAKQSWSGILTLGNLIALRNFGRIRGLESWTRAPG